MNTSDDRVDVPTNGHRPALARAATGLEDTTDLDDATDLGAGRPTIHVAPPSRLSLPTVSTGQLAAGFGVLVALALLVIGRRRGRRG